MRALRRFALITLSGPVLAACTQQGVYTGLQQGQRNECQKIPETLARERCLQNAGVSYDDYRKHGEDQPDAGGN